MDSTFAFAHRRLATVYGWSGDLDSPLRAREEIAAARNPERLPERERAIPVAYVLWTRDGDYQAALDSLESHLRRYPDDAEALNVRAEVLSHGTGLGVFDLTDSAVLAAFEAAFRVDPGLGPAMIHPMGLSVRMGDSTRFRRYATRVMGAQLRDDAEVAGLVGSAIDLLWGRDVSNTAFVRRVLDDPALQSIGWEAAPLPTMIMSGRDPNPVLDTVLKWSLDGVDTLSLAMVAGTLLATGRLTEARRVLHQLEGEAPVTVLRLKATAETFGIAGPEFLPPVWPDPPAPLTAGEDVAWLAVVQATLDLTHGDTSSAVEALAPAAAASHRFPPAVEASRAFQVGRLQILRGDVESGLRAMEAGLRAAEIAPMVEMAPPTFFHRIFLAEAHAEHPPTRGRGIEELRGLLGCCPPIEPLIRLYLGRALEAEGQQRAALVQYGIVAMQTDRAGGSLAAMNAEARRAIKRLAVEG